MIGKIETNNVNFWYGDFHALKGISMSIEERSVVAFIGPSGCGKSTWLVRMNCMIFSCTISCVVVSALPRYFFLQRVRLRICMMKRPLRSGCKYSSAVSSISNSNALVCRTDLR